MAGEQRFRGHAAFAALLRMQPGRLRDAEGTRPRL